MGTEQADQQRDRGAPDQAELDAVAGRVAADTHPVELTRLAMEHAQHADSDPLATQVLLWVVRASNALLAAQAEALRSVELSPSAFNVLMALRNTPGGVLEPCDIADRLLVTRPSVTGLLDTLESKGLVERGAHPDDRRRRLVHLTDRAHEVLSSQLSGHYAALHQLLADLDDPERRELVGLLRRIEGAAPEALLVDDTGAEADAEVRAEALATEPLQEPVEATSVTAAG